MKRQLAGKNVDPVGLGCMNVAWAYGTPPSREDAVKLFRRALDTGYDHFDTANIYGMGDSEEILAEAIMDRRDEFLLATKTGIIVEENRRGIDCSPAAMTQSIEDSLKRLKTDHVDLFYMHRFDPKVPIADSVGALADAIAAGKIGAYGVSEWSSDHIREAHAVHPVAAVQTEYSLTTRNVELGVLEATKELGIALVAFSPVGRGMLTGALGQPLELTEKDLRNMFPRFDEENWPHNLELANRYNALAKDAGVTPSQLALLWVLSRGEHLHAIPGTASIEHMLENGKASELSVSDDVLEEAGRIFNQSTVAGHRYPEMIRGTIDTEDYV